MRLAPSLLFVISSLALNSIALASEGITRIQSQHSVAATVGKLEAIFQKKGITVFAKIDHQAGAKSVGQEIPATTVIIFGNPKLGTPLIQCAPQVAIDLPQKMLVNEDAKGEVWISYNKPAYLAKRHEIKGCEKALAKTAGALKKIVGKASE